jgi:very-short-patch-repair endonuclease
MGWRLPQDRWLIAELDGRAFHETASAVLHDRRRQNALMLSGKVDLLRFTSSDVAAGDVLSAAIRSALARRTGHEC